MVELGGLTSVTGYDGIHKHETDEVRRRILEEENHKDGKADKKEIHDNTCAAKVCVAIVKQRPN